MMPLKIMPKTENIPELNINIEGLKRHSVMCIFRLEPTLSEETVKLRSWLLHTLTTGTRHYKRARELAAKQETADQTRDGGAIFYILDISEQIEGCISAIYRIWMAIKRMGNKGIHNVDIEHINTFDDAIKSLSDLRNQFEHMHSQAVSGETGRGPISMSFGNNGKMVRFRRKTIKTAQLHHLIEEAYKVIAGFFPGFSADSTPEVEGPIRLSMSVKTTITTSVFPADNKKG